MCQLVTRECFKQGSYVRCLEASQLMQTVKTPFWDVSVPDTFQAVLFCFLLSVDWPILRSACVERSQSGILILIVTRIDSVTFPEWTHRVNETNTCTDILRRIKEASIVALPQRGDHVEIVSAQENSWRTLSVLYTVYGFINLNSSAHDETLSYNFIIHDACMQWLVSHFPISLWCMQFTMRIHSVPRVPHPSCDACSWEAYRKAVEVVWGTYSKDLVNVVILHWIKYM